MKRVRKNKISISRGRVFVLYLSLFVHALVSVGSAAGGVLCFKTNGHVAVEPASVKACCSSSHATSTAPKRMEASLSHVKKSCCSSSKPVVRPASITRHAHMGNHCRTCLDISTLLNGVMQGSTHSNAILSLPKVEAFLLSFPIPVSQRISRGSFISQSLSPPTLALQRTVVLLI